MGKDPLKEYVERQAASNTDPRIVRYNLVRAGWPAQKVDKELWKYYSKDRKTNIPGNKHLLRALVLVVIFLVGIMFFIYSGVQDVIIKPAPVEGPQTPDSQITPSGVVEMKTCDSLNEATEKDECYKVKVSEGFDCDGLEDKIERNFCFRALDASLFSS